MSTLSPYDGEAVPVFYRRDKFELVDAYHFWLSEWVGLKRDPAVSSKWELETNSRPNAENQTSLARRAGEPYVC